MKTRMRCSGSEISASRALSFLENGGEGVLLNQKKQTLFGLEVVIESASDMPVARERCAHGMRPSYPLEQKTSVAWSRMCSRRRSKRGRGSAACGSAGRRVPRRGVRVAGKAGICRTFVPIIGGVIEITRACDVYAPSLTTTLG